MSSFRWHEMTTTEIQREYDKVVEERNYWRNKYEQEKDAMNTDPNEYVAPVDEESRQKWYKQTAQMFLDLNNSNLDPDEVYPKNRYSGD